ncbi:uncharacterized protein [Primulina eburnea]|uniref:uncharacterized protein n=1 Tax=Primulina eburnea TaxID=1245227 RepID=UPI003C6CBE96
MSSRFQAAVLVSAPCYSNAVAWSEENLVAVASGSLVTILNPAKPSGAGCRGVISVLPSKPFSIGFINAGGIDFLSGCLLPMHVSRDTRPCVRSISWSPAGLASNAGCLLAVCTTGGRVKLYRFPFCDFSAEWIEVIGSRDNAESECPNEPPVSSLRKERKRRRQNETNVAAKKLDNVKEKNTWEIIPISVSEGTPLKIKECNVQLITAQQYASRNAMLTPLIVAWSPIMRTSEDWSEDLIITVDSAPVSILSFTAPLQTPLNLFLAIGKGSGSFEVWTMNMTSHEFEIIGCYSAHDHIVTGLAWAFDGLCLYRCSQKALRLKSLVAVQIIRSVHVLQDNSMKAWNLVGKALREINIPSNTPGLNSSPDVPYVYDSCFGQAVSHGSLAIAVARRFDSDLLNPMYQERTQKAAIEFLWIGGQQLDTSSNICFDIDFGSFPGFPEWASEHLGYCGSPSVFQTVDTKLCRAYSAKMLHLINVIIRHVVLKNDEVSESRKHQDLERFSSAIEEQTNVWKELQLCCENDLRRRLVGLYFSAILDLLSDVPTNFCDVGCWRTDEWPQLEHNISLHEKIVEDDLKFLVAKVGKIKKRRQVGRLRGGEERRHEDAEDRRREEDLPPPPPLDMNAQMLAGMT